MARNDPFRAPWASTRLERVGRTGRDEPAGRGPVLMADLVPADEAGQAAGHQAGARSPAVPRTPPRSRRRPWLPGPDRLPARRGNPVPHRGTAARVNDASAPTRYHPGARASAWVRASARSRRRTRLRTGALPTARPTAKPTLGGAAAGSAITDIHSEPHARSASVAPEPCEHRTVPDAPDHAERRTRPLARRDLMMARPARVDIRCRNPWRLARLRLFGWYVRFTLPPDFLAPRSGRRHMPSARPARWRAERPWGPGRGEPRTCDLARANARRADDPGYGVGAANGNRLRVRADIARQRESRAVTTAGHRAVTPRSRGLDSPPPGACYGRTSAPGGTQVAGGFVRERSWRCPQVHPHLWTRFRLQGVRRW